MPPGEPPRIDFWNQKLTPKERLLEPKTCLPGRAVSEQFSCEPGFPVFRGSAKGGMENLVFVADTGDWTTTGKPENHRKTQFNTHTHTNTNHNHSHNHKLRAHIPGLEPGREVPLPSKN